MFYAFYTLSNSAILNIVVYEILSPIIALCQLDIMYITPDFCMIVELCEKSCNECCIA